MFTAKKELLSQCLPEVIPILEDHWRELARNRDTIRLNPTWETYTALENAGSYRAYIVRAQNGEVAGYAGYIVSRNLHYSDHLWATSDLFFVRPQYRRKWSLGKLWPKNPTKGAGTVLFECVETDLRQFGVSVMHSTFKLANPAAGSLLKKLGHVPIEMGMAKVLR